MSEARILSVTYEISLLSSRQAVLQSAGYDVQSASDLRDAVELVMHRGFQLVIVGQDVPEHHQQAIISAARIVTCKTLLLTVSPLDTHLGADANVDPYDGPYVLLEQLSRVLSGTVTKRPTRAARASAATGASQQNSA